MPHAMSAGSRGGIDDPVDRRDLVGREARNPCMFPDRGFVLGQVDAERLVGGDVGMLPLEPWGASLESAALRFAAAPLSSGAGHLADSRMSRSMTRRFSMGFILFCVPDLIAGCERHVSTDCGGSVSAVDANQRGDPATACSALTLPSYAVRAAPFTALPPTMVVMRETSSRWSIGLAR